MKPERVDNRGITLCARAYLDAVANGKDPVRCIGLRGGGKLVRCLVVEGGLGWRAEDTSALGFRHCTRLRGIGGERVPTEPIGAIKTQRLDGVVDGGQLLVGE